MTAPDVAACPVCGANHQSNITHDRVWLVPVPDGPPPPASLPPDVERAEYPCVEGLNGSHYAHARCLREAGWHHDRP